MFENVLVGVDGRPSRPRRDRARLAAAGAAVARSRWLTSTVASTRPARGHARARAGGPRARPSSCSSRNGPHAGVEAELIAVAGAHARAGTARTGRGARLPTCSWWAAATAACSAGRCSATTPARALNGAPCAVAIAPLGYAEHVEADRDDRRRLRRLGRERGGARAARVARARDAAPGSARCEVVPLPAYTYGLVGPPVERRGSATPPRPGADGGARRRRGPRRLRARRRGARGFGGEVDLLIVGSRSYGPLRRLVLGSTSDHLPVTPAGRS